MGSSEPVAQSLGSKFSSWKAAFLQSYRHSNPKGRTRAPRWAPVVPSRGTATGAEHLEGEMKGTGDTKMAARQVPIKLRLYFSTTHLYIIKAGCRAGEGGAFRRAGHQAGEGGGAYLVAAMLVQVGERLQGLKAQGHTRLRYQYYQVWPVQPCLSTKRSHAAWSPTYPPFLSIKQKWLPVRPSMMSEQCLS